MEAALSELLAKAIEVMVPVILLYCSERNGRSVTSF